MTDNENQVDNGQWQNRGGEETSTGEGSREGGDRERANPPSEGTLTPSYRSRTLSDIEALPPHYLDDDSYSDGVSPIPHRYHANYYGPLRASSTLRHVQRVSKRAALASKKVIWDSNDNAIDAAQSAVDQWEEAYNALRGLLVASFKASAQSAKGLYGATKAGATGLEHGILLPVRDWILLPAFDAAEKTVGFLQSDQAHQLALQSLQLAHQIPVIGPSFVAPAMVLSVKIFQTTWHIVQYPIPSRHQVRNSVDFVLTGTKWALSTAGREIFLYMRRADAIITRTLSHTQWRVLGSGPYETLDKLNKQEVIDHLCERYFSLKGTIARYELAAHIRAHNLSLYLDLVLTGLLRERGGELTKYDEWLSSCPSYRKNSKGPFLLPNYDHEGDGAGCSRHGSELSIKQSALWFRLPYINGKRPGRDVAWVRFKGEDRAKLERRYLEVFKEGKCKDNHTIPARNPSPVAMDENAVIQENGLERPATQLGAEEEDDHERASGHKVDDESQNIQDEIGLDVSSRYPTVAKWYVPNLSKDVLVDQKRYSVSFHNCCPRCRHRLDSNSNYGEVCRQCTDNEAGVTNHFMASSIMSPPPISMVMRPNLWRFHGPGDEVRRAVWFLDTRRHGLQPYGEEAQAVLEDAYLFLKWRNEYLKEGPDKVKDESHKPVNENTCPENGKTSGDGSEEDDPMGESALLTVQVESPDGGEQQLVQFSSLTAATAIKKGLGGAISLFKRRVYRGADLSHPKLPESAKGVTPEAVFSGDVKLKSSCPLQPKQKSEGPNKQTDRDECGFDFSIDIHQNDDECGEEWTLLSTPSEEKSLSVPAVQFDDIDRDPCDKNKAKEEDDIDHLVLIVHGIGEMLQSVDIFGLNIPNLSSIIECCGFLRKNHAEVQSARFSQMYPTAESISTASTGRVEYLPVEWHEAFSIVSQRRFPMVPPESKERSLIPPGCGRSQVMMNDISLRTIPQLRGFANDTLFDVLYFMSSEHHDVIIDIVTTEMNVVAQKFRALMGFSGRVSVIGHSLGSIILWDILANQSPTRIDEPSFMNKQNNVYTGGLNSADMKSGDWENISGINSSTGHYSEASSPLSVKDDHRDESRPAETKVHMLPANWHYPRLLFDVDNAFMLGSPIAVFLMVRNQRKPLSANFSLKGCARVMNIFHPYDPVAYRIEPLIDPRNAEFEPRIMTHWNGGFRVQYQTKRLLRKLIQTTVETQAIVLEKLEAGIAGMGLLDMAGDGIDEDNQSQPSYGVMHNDDRPAAHIVTGKLNQGRRIDYMLQEKEIEAANEYVAALAAHSCYWQEKDLSLFIARQIYLSRLAQEQALHFEDLLPLEEAVTSQP